MKRRDLIKTAVVASLVALVPTTKIKAKTGIKTKIKNPDWNCVVMGRGFEVFVRSVCTVLELFLNGDGVRAHHSARVIYCWLYGGAAFPNQQVRFDIDQYSGFYVALIEYNKNNHKQMIDLLNTRWIDWLWCINDGINNRIDLIRRFDPDYNPDKRRELEGNENEV